jgi:hypothetical protein
VSDYCFMSREHFSAISWQEQVAFWWDDDDDEDVCFVQDQYAKLDNYSASSLKQQSTGRYVTPLRHSRRIPSHPVFAHTHQCCVLKVEGADTNFLIFGLIRPVLFPTHENSMPTITPLMQSVFL